MKKLSGLTATIIACVAILGATSLVRASSSAEDEIKALEDRFAKAVEAKDVNGIMANYVTGDSLVVFDIILPRQYVGWNSYKKDWQGFLSECKDAVKFEITDLSITASGKVAFGHSIQHMTCTATNGLPMDLTTRTTDGYVKKDADPQHLTITRRTLRRISECED
jgi:ketosteroid isomerase-like protein